MRDKQNHFYALMNIITYIETNDTLKLIVTTYTTMRATIFTL